MELLLSFFRQCNKENIDYCIWKSSNQLESSLNGKTDFDIFVNNSHKDIFDKLFKKNNFFFTVSSKKKEYLDNEYDAFLIDEKLNLIHFHIYSMIIIGAKNNKNYKFLFNNEIFQTSKYDNLYDIKNTCFKIHSLKRVYEKNGKRLRSLLSNGNILRRAV